MQEGREDTESNCYGVGEIRKGLFKERMIETANGNLGGRMSIIPFGFWIFSFQKHAKHVLVYLLNFNFTYFVFCKKKF